MTCDCARTANVPISTTTDLGEFLQMIIRAGVRGLLLVLDTVMKNVDGIISCHDFLGE